ncbi:MAG: BMP family ABC transporter substrate-binding protein [Propionibacteriaceae bacterium]|jgi:basic membrane protein A|nr:BMP family ABC transporter substrate-binding protein [Propionibacteriaceae bacterium]
MTARLVPTAALALLAALAGCTGDSGPAPDDNLLSIVHVTAGGTLEDGGFTADAEAALDRLRADGHRTQTVEAAADPAALKAAVEQASDNWGIVVGSSELAAAVQEVAPAHPDQRYIVYGAAVAEPNVASIAYRQNEGGFLAGVLAALVTTAPDGFPHATGSRDIAVVGGADSLAVQDCLAGFKAGVHAVDPSIPIQTAFIGDSKDADKAYSIARSLYLDNNADVIFQLAGPAGAGVFKAAAETGRYAIGSGAGENAAAAGHVLASAFAKAGDGLYMAVQAVETGTLVWGSTTSYGLAQGVVVLSYDDNSAIVPQGVQDQVADFAKQISEYKLYVPSALR